MVSIKVDIYPRYTFPLALFMRSFTRDTATSSDSLLRPATCLPVARFDICSAAGVHSEPDGRSRPGKLLWRLVLIASCDDGDDSHAERGPAPDIGPY